MIRVCCVIGTWQLITLVASLEQVRLEDTNGAPCDDYLVVYETAGVPDEFKNILQRMAQAAWPWKRIVWAYDLMASDYDLTQRAYDRLRRTIRERVGVPYESVDEIWVCWLTRPAEKLIFAAFPSARLVLYEDGLISFLPITVPRRLPYRERAGLPVSLFLRAADRVLDGFPALRFRLSGWKLDPHHLRRLSRVYSILPESEPLPEMISHVPRHPVEYQTLRDVLQRVSDALRDEIADAAAFAGDSPNQVLILGQALSRNHIMSRDDELGFYQNVVKAVLDKGYDVLWKEHPRISEPFFGDLRRYVATLGVPDGRVRQLNLPHAFPVELVAGKLHLAACVTGTSAAVFYLRRLYGIPCYTFAEALLPRMQGADVFMNDMVRREAPPLSDLPPTLSEKPAPLLAEQPIVT